MGQEKRPPFPIDIPPAYIASPDDVFPKGRSLPLPRLRLPHGSTHIMLPLMLLFSSQANAQTPAPTVRVVSVAIMLRRVSGRTGALAA